MAGDCLVGKCNICGKENVPLVVKYYHYPIICECHNRHSIRIEHCKDCVPKEPETTKIELKTSLLKELINERDYGQLNSVPTLKRENESLKKILNNYTPRIICNEPFNNEQACRFEIAILALICTNNYELAWKSFRDNNNNIIGENKFIVGVSIPSYGTAIAYECNIDDYWDFFKFVSQYDKAPCSYSKSPELIIKAIESLIER